MWHFNTSCTCFHDWRNQESKLIFADPEENVFVGFVALMDEMEGKGVGNLSARHFCLSDLVPLSETANFMQKLSSWRGKTAAKMLEGCKKQLQPNWRPKLTKSSSKAFASSILGTMRWNVRVTNLNSQKCKTGSGERAKTIPVTNVLIAHLCRWPFPLYLSAPKRNPK